MAAISIGGGPFGSIGPQRVLICDDERHVARLLQVNFERQGHKVSCAFDGRDAMQKMEAADPPFDRIVLDVMLPLVDGFELFQWIRRREEMRYAWVAIIGSRQQDFEMFENLPYRPDKYLVKPFNPMELFR